jgi:MoxR-like ATPase
VAPLGKLKAFEMPPGMDGAGAQDSLHAGALLSVEQPDAPTQMSKKEYFMDEYGGPLKGTERSLPYIGGAYEVGKRFPAAEGMGVPEGHEGNPAIAVGANLPLAGVMMAHNPNIVTLEREHGGGRSSQVHVWYGQGAGEYGAHSPADHEPMRCENCGAFVSPGKPCARCSTLAPESDDADDNPGLFAAAYDVNSHEAACFVPGCPGQVDGKPCPHQVGAMVSGLTAFGERLGSVSGRQPLIEQLDDALKEYGAAVQAGDEDRARELAVKLGDAGYVLANKYLPDGGDEPILSFGSRDLAEFVRDSNLAAELDQALVTDAEDGAVEDDYETRYEQHAALIAAHLRDIQPPVPSDSPMLPAQHNPDYMVTDQAAALFRDFAIGLTAGYREGARGMDGRVFGLYGPPGTGKNSIAEETAAALGMPYREIDVGGADTDIRSLIGDVTIESDGLGGTRSVAKLGPLGQALVDGEVVALNEIVHADRDAQAMLNGIAQNGVIQLQSPEGATSQYRVHPSSLLFMTWNPQGGRADRPLPSLTSRASCRPVNFASPEDEAAMLSKWSRADGLENVSTSDVKKTVQLLNDLREAAKTGIIDEYPTFRHMQQFMRYWKASGEVEAGVRALDVLTSQMEDHDAQWQQVEALVQRNFG